MKKNLTRRSFIAAGATASLALAACGSKDSDTTDSGLTPLTFCLDWAPNTNHTGL